MNTPIYKRILALLALAAFLAVLLLIPAYLYADALYREEFDARNPIAAHEGAEPTVFDLYAEEGEHQTKARIAGWMSTVVSQEAAVSTPRGMLHGTHYAPVGEKQNAPWAVVFHGGLGTAREQVRDIACVLSLRGYHVLTPDLYAHGESDGEASTLGFGDAQDVRAWIDYVRKEQMDAKIVLFGVDEGASAVLSAACDGLEECVSAIAADSACDNGVARMLSLSDEKEGSLRAELLQLMFRKRTGITSKLSERIGQVKTPVLLIHGTGDQQVHAWQSEDIALAAGENAQVLLIEGAGHGLSRFVEPQRYYDTLLTFFSQAL